jgi:predicted glycosyltransferase
MKIFIDIGHPAHVHYFRNFIQLMQEKGHEFFVSARDRSIIHYLLRNYNIPFYSRGKGKNGILGKLLYIFIADIKLFNQASKFKPDIYMSFASPYAAHVSWLLGKPHIVIDDTEHARFGHIFYKSFSTVFLNPKCFHRDFGPNQIRFNSFTELFYLHSKYFLPDKTILSLLKLNQGEKYVLLRFVSWEAHHDIGHYGLDIETRKLVVNLLIEKGFNIFISSESDKINPDFEPYLINIPPERMHDVLSYCELFVSESGTMASESAILGTPVVYVNSLPLMGYLEEEQKAGMLFAFQSSEGVIEKIKELLSLPNLRESFQLLNQKMLIDKIDVVAFLVWFVENYPGSVKIMKEHPEYQTRFR